MVEQERLSYRELLTETGIGEVTAIQAEQESGDGRRRNKSSLTAVLREALGTWPDFRGGAYAVFLDIINRYNKEVPEDCRLHPTVFAYPKSKHYVIPWCELPAAIELAKKHEAELVPHLPPFRITQDEWKQIKQGQEDAREKIRQRLIHWGETTVGEAVDPSNRLDVVMAVVENPKIWEVLLESPPPFPQSGRFHNIFRVAINWKIQYHLNLQKRAQLEAEKEADTFWLLRGGPLYEFFGKNPPGSEMANWLLSCLDERQRGVFVQRFLERKSTREIAETLRARKDTVRHSFISTRSFLEALVVQPPGDWSRKFTSAADMLKNKHPELYGRFLATKPQRQQTYAQLKYNGRLHDAEIARRLGVSREAVGAWRVRFEKKLIEAARAAGIIA